MDAARKVSAKPGVFRLLDCIGHLPKLDITGSGQSLTSISLITTARF